VTWLLVEDDNDIRNIVSVMITVWGEKALAFPDGYAAWNWLDTVSSDSPKDALPSLALMDIRMPGYTGDRIAARIRERLSATF
jgi:CheY-like chemotaxis protein